MVSGARFPLGLLFILGLVITNAKNIDLVWLYTVLGRLYRNQANYSAAELWYERCLELC
jgi:hypothetical protein